ncbi:MAG TPA: hypothetical protein VG146_01830 [Verrucomicrobiae bacterium]|nr:hypothetical protein [Verrucomicrobiae bacterium]
MRIWQWEIWKAKVPGFAVDHWFVLLSGQERLDNPKHQACNGLICYTLRGPPISTDVRLDAADGFRAATACQCDFLWVLDKRTLHSQTGTVSWERQQQIRSKVREILRL